MHSIEYPVPKQSGSQFLYKSSLNGLILIPFSGILPFERWLIVVSSLKDGLHSKNVTIAERTQQKKAINLSLRIGKKKIVGRSQTTVKVVSVQSIEERNLLVKKRLVVFVVLVLCLLLTSAFTFNSTQQVNKDIVGHCVMMLNPIRPGEKSSEVVSYNCYSTFSQSISAATGGRIHLASSVRPQDVTRAMLQTGESPNTTFIIGIEYKDSNYKGDTLSYGTSSGGCSPYQSFGVTSMPAGWDNVISSVAGDLDYCYWTVLWENTNYGGARLNVAGSTSYVGNAMNDQTSSIYWRCQSCSL